MGIRPPEPNIPGESNAKLIYVPVIVFSILCPAIVSVRVWTRLQNQGRLGADDWLIIVALFIALASSGIMVASCQYGYGQHGVNLTPYNKVQANMWFFVCQTTYKWSISATKCSILLLYLRIFNKIRWLKWTCWILITIIGLFLIAASAASVFQCTPMERAFDKTIEGHCIDNTKNWYANALFSITTDTIILLLPIRLVMLLQISRLQKVALSLVFTLGIFVVFTSCMRMTTLNITATTPDVTYDIASTMWSIIEMNVAIMCACLPMVRPLIVKMFPRMATAFKSKAGAAGYGYGKYGANSRGYVSSHSRSENEQSDWPKTGIALTSVHRMDQNSEEYILHDSPSSRDSPPAHENNITRGATPDSRRHQGIHKTVQYSVEYSKGREKQTQSHAFA